MYCSEVVDGVPTGGPGIWLYGDPSCQWYMACIIYIYNIYTNHHNHVTYIYIYIYIYIYKQPTSYTHTHYLSVQLQPEFFDEASRP